MIEALHKTLTPSKTAYILIFLSGFVALIYQVLWMKQIALIFGNTSHAASTTLAAFFAGLAVGSWFLGKRVVNHTKPMLTYARLECGIAVTAVIYFLILGLYRFIYPFIYQNVESTVLLLFIKLLLALLLIFPTAFFMGGTIPVMGQFMVHNRTLFAKTSALIYAFNTLGAALGAALAGFYLPLEIGFNATCILAILISLGIAIIAFFISRVTYKPGSASSVNRMNHAYDDVENNEDPKSSSMSRQERRANERKKERQNVHPVSKESQISTKSGKNVLLFLCFLSGFSVLALEVLWTRMFSQVLENSVYTFAAILVVVLVCLAVGAMLSSLLARATISPKLILTFLVIIGVSALTALPHMFMYITNGMEIISSTAGWIGYVMVIFRAVILTIGPSAIVLGTIFPYLMKIEESEMKAAGQSLGRLVTFNTVGAIFGALFCGFVLLEALGIWRSIQCIAIMYLLAVLFLPLDRANASVVAKCGCLALMLVNLLSLDTKKIPQISIDPLAHKEKVIETWEGSNCSISVTESRVGTSIKINSHYSLGSSGAYMQEKLQTDLPLMVYPKTQSLFFLGLGTGITAGAALDPRHNNVNRIVACELVPEVVTASKKYFTKIKGFDYTTGLYKDPRAKVLVEDGRHHLLATKEQYDIINADLFIPFRSGAGNLYTMEHFQSSKNRLTPNGVFVQWLPLYQLTKNEFSIIARTMIEVFDTVSMWRHNFQPGDEVVALIGHQKGNTIPTSNINSFADKALAIEGKDHRDLMRLNLPLNSQTILFFYAGNLTASRKIFDSYPLNTDDKPLIEYQAPRSYRQGSSNNSPWLVSSAFADLVDTIQSICPPDNDPLLINRNFSNKCMPIAGSAFHRARIEMVKGNIAETEASWKKFVSNWIVNDLGNPSK